MVSPYDFMENEDPPISNTGVVNTWNSSTLDGGTRCLIDWLGFTFKADGIKVEHVIEWFKNCLGIDKDVWHSGRRFYRGYADSLVFENITIYYNGADKQGIHIDFSGQGCRYIDILFEKLQIHNEKLPKEYYLITNWKDLFRALYYVDDINITRLDIAVDDFIGLIEVDKLFYKSLNGELTMKFRSWHPDGKFNSDGKTNGISLYYGSDQSDTQLTIYEKNKQLGLDKHWTRLELQFRRNRAESVVQEILESGKDIGIIFGGILKYYLTFKDRGKDKNKSRWKVSGFWEELFLHIEELPIASAMPDRSIIKNHFWLDKQVSRTLARLFFAYDGIDSNWLRNIVKTGIDKLNDDDIRLISEFRRLMEKEKEPTRIGSHIDI